MARIHTHYENLKVARNAPLEVIRAAYKTLSLKYHPDKNPGDKEAARIMVILNTSYEVLSDSEKRRAHDLWIEKMEADNHVSKESKQSAQPTQKISAYQSLFLRILNFISPIVVWVLSYALGIGALAVALWLIVTVSEFFGSKSSPSPAPKPYQSNPSFAKPAYEYPLAAPNGEPWPTSSGYIQGYPRLRADGLSTVTVDNRQSDSDVFVKLVFIDGARAYPVRQFFIPAFGTFTLENVGIGSYDIRYRDLRSGSLSRSESFSIEEIKTYDGIQYSNISMTLYKVRNGNTQTYNLSETEF